jgi:hypothetical protein
MHTDESGVNRITERVEGPLTVELKAVGAFDDAHAAQWLNDLKGSAFLPAVELRMVSAGDWRIAYGF